METSKSEALKFEDIIARVEVCVSDEKQNYLQDKQIAHALGLSATNFSNCKKRNTIPYENLVVFARKYGVSLDFLLCGEFIPKGYYKYNMNRRETPFIRKDSFFMTYYLKR